MKVIEYYFFSLNFLYNYCYFFFISYLFFCRFENWFPDSGRASSWTPVSSPLSSPSQSARPWSSPHPYSQWWSSRQCTHGTHVYSFAAYVFILRLDSISLCKSAPFSKQCSVHWLNHKANTCNNFLAGVLTYQSVRRYVWISYHFFVIHEDNSALFLSNRLYKIHLNLNFKIKEK